MAIDTKSKLKPPTMLTRVVRCQLLSSSSSVLAPTVLSGGPGGSGDGGVGGKGCGGGGGLGSGGDGSGGLGVGGGGGGGSDGGGMDGGHEYATIGVEVDVTGVNAFRPACTWASSELVFSWAVTSLAEPLNAVGIAIVELPDVDNKTWEGAEIDSLSKEDRVDCKFVPSAGNGLLCT